MSTIQPEDHRIKACRHLTNNGLCLSLKIIVNPLFVAAKDQLSPQVLRFFMHLLKESNSKIEKLLKEKSQKELENNFLVMEYNGRDYEIYLSHTQEQNPQIQQVFSQSKDPIELTINKVISNKKSAQMKLSVIFQVNDCPPKCTTYSPKMEGIDFPDSINKECKFLQTGEKDSYCCNFEKIIHTCKGCPLVEEVEFDFPTPTE